MTTLKTEKGNLVHRDFCGICSRKDFPLSHGQILVSCKNEKGLSMDVICHLVCWHNAKTILEKTEFKVLATMPPNSNVWNNEYSQGAK